MPAINPDPDDPLQNRMPQSTFAWVLLFVLFPPAALVIYIMFGRGRYAFSRAQTVAKLLERSTLADVRHGSWRRSRTPSQALRARRGNSPVSPACCGPRDDRRSRRATTSRFCRTPARNIPGCSTTCTRRRSRYTCSITNGPPTPSQRRLANSSATKSAKVLKCGFSTTRSEAISC